MIFGTGRFMRAPMSRSGLRARDRPPRRAAKSAVLVSALAALQRSLAGRPLPVPNLNAVLSAGGTAVGHGDTARAEVPWIPGLFSTGCPAISGGAGGPTLPAFARLSPC